MSQLIIKDGEMIRINPKDSTKLEYSKNNGRSWATRFSGSSIGAFHDLNDVGKEILAQTDKGLYYSKTNGRMWAKRS
jgi:hypothetical protein